VKGISKTRRKLISKVEKTLFSNECIWICPQESVEDYIYLAHQTIGLKVI
jgi:hypothetical protein